MDTDSPKWVERFAYIPTYLDDIKAWVWFQEYYEYKYSMPQCYSYVQQRSREKVLLERE